MPCTVLIAAKSDASPPLVAHSFDTPGGVDFRLVRVPRCASPPSPRPVFRWDEEAVPRFVGDARGAIDAYAEGAVAGGFAPTPVLGHVPAADGATFAYWEAACGLANEKGVMLAESTCSAIFGADVRASAAAPDGPLLGYMELSRIALERCASARAAIELMGALAEAHGFAGNDAALPGAAESFGVIDAEDAWVFHVLPDDTRRSAVWCAQRVPEGHAAVIANMLCIRDVDLGDARGANFLRSASATEVAARHGLWAPGEPFDFARIFSAGEARHRFYSGRRVWRALSLFAPSLGLEPHYDDLLLDRPYPFSVKPDAPLRREDLVAVLRDNYEGTPFDLARGPASGPFGCSDRYDGANGCNAPAGDEPGAFERPIGTYRMAYSFVGEATPGRPALHFAPHASTTSLYFPVLCACETPPAPLARGTVRAIDRASAYWAFRLVKHVARGLPWDRCLEAIRARQQAWEARFARALETASDDDGATLRALADEAVADWGALHDELLLRFGDGWEFDFAGDGRRPIDTGKPIAYPREYLDLVGFNASHAPPPPVLWTVAEKQRVRGGGVV